MSRFFIFRQISCVSGLLELSHAKYPILCRGLVSDYTQHTGTVLCGDPRGGLQKSPEPDENEEGNGAAADKKEGHRTSLRIIGRRRGTKETKICSGHPTIYRRGVGRRTRNQPASRGWDTYRRTSTSVRRSEDRNRTASGQVFLLLVPHEYTHEVEIE